MTNQRENNIIDDFLNFIQLTIRQQNQHWKELDLIVARELDLEEIDQKIFDSIEDTR